MKGFICIYLLALATFSYSQNLCERAILTSLSDTSIAFKEFLYSGKFFNELGSYLECQISNGYTYKYVLGVIHEDPYSIFDHQFVWGFCMLNECDLNSLSYMNNLFINLAKKELGYANPQIEYIDP